MIPGSHWGALTLELPTLNKELSLYCPVTVGRDQAWPDRGVGRMQGTPPDNSLDSPGESADHAVTLVGTPVDARPGIPSEELAH